MVTRGPIQVIELMAEIKPRQNDGADNATAVLTENVFAGDETDLELAANVRLWRRQQKTAFRKT